MLYKKLYHFWVKLVYLIRDLNLVIFRKTLLLPYDFKCYLFKLQLFWNLSWVFSDHMITLLLDLFTVMAVDNIADIFPKFRDFESIVFWVSDWETSYWSAFAIDWASCSPDSGNWFPRMMTLWLVVLMLRISALERVDDSGNLLKEKLRWPLAWL